MNEQQPETGDQPPASAVRRVLIYRLGSLGDTLVAVPSFRLIARAFPNAERRLLTNFPVNVKAPPAASILDHTGLVAGYIRYQVGLRRPGAITRLWATIAAWRPEVLVYLGSARGIPSAQRDERFFRLCGIRQLIGVPLTEDMQKSRWQQERNALEPEAERLARNIGELGDARLDDPASWDLGLTPSEIAHADSVLGDTSLRPLIAVSDRCPSRVSVSSRNLSNCNPRERAASSGKAAPATSSASAIDPLA